MAHTSRLSSLAAHTVARCPLPTRYTTRGLQTGRQCDVRRRAASAHHIEQGLHAPPRRVPTSRTPSPRGTVPPRHSRDCSLPISRSYAPDKVLEESYTPLCERTVRHLRGDVHRDLSSHTRGTHRPQHPRQPPVNPLLCTALPTHRGTSPIALPSYHRMHHRASAAPTDPAPANAHVTRLVRHRLRPAPL